MFLQAKTIVWLLCMALFGAASGALFYVDRLDLGLAWVRLWGLRLLLLSFFLFCFGMLWRNTLAKSLLFSLAAAALALGSMEYYLAWRNGLLVSAHVQPVMTGIPEFDDEKRNQINLATIDQYFTDTEQAESEFVTNEGEARKILADQGYVVKEKVFTANKYFQPDPLLGYRIIKSEEPTQVLAIKHNSGKIAYSVIYTLNTQGWRVTPHHPNADEAVVFMGCSFTFGLGLNDEDSYPYKVAEMLGDGYEVFNMGVGGYGTHQVLAMIENGYLDDISKKYKKLHVFYMAIEDHKFRVSGKSSWDTDGPAYKLMGDGSVKYMGTFQQMARQEQSQSLLWKRVDEDKKMSDLHAGIIKQANNDLKKRYHTGLVLVKSCYSEPVPYLDNLSASDGIAVVDVLANVTMDELIPGDLHPNAKGASIMAEKIVDFIRRKERP